MDLVLIAVATSAFLVWAWPRVPALTSRVRRESEDQRLTGPPMRWTWGRDYFVRLWLIGIVGALWVAVLLVAF